MGRSDDHLYVDVGGLKIVTSNNTDAASKVLVRLEGNFIEKSPLLGSNILGSDVIPKVLHRGCDHPVTHLVSSSRS